jgi:hypothetical protein
MAIRDGGWGYRFAREGCEEETAIVSLSSIRRVMKQEE